MKAGSGTEHRTIIVDPVPREPEAFLFRPGPARTPHRQRHVIGYYEDSLLEYGSDLVGSIRIPAGFCGVYGLKLSAGIVPLSGFQPPGLPPPLSDMTYTGAVGPLGRSAPDLRTALSVTGGPEGQQAKAYSWALSPSRHTRLEDFRVGVGLDHEQAPVSSEVTALLSNAVDALARAGATVVEGWPDGVDPMRNFESFGFHIT